MILGNTDGVIRCGFGASAGNTRRGVGSVRGIPPFDCDFQRVVKVHVPDDADKCWKPSPKGGLFLNA